MLTVIFFWDFLVIRQMTEFMLIFFPKQSGHCNVPKLALSGWKWHKSRLIFIQNDNELNYTIQKIGKERLNSY